VIVEALTLVTVGALVGALGTLIGAGGGFLLVPLLLLVYHLPPPDAVGTSLAVVFLNAVSGTLAYLRQRRVDLGLGLRFAAATLPGAIGGAYFTRTLSSNAFALGFGVLLLLIAGLLFTGKTARPSGRATSRTLVDAAGEAHGYTVDTWKGVALSLVVGGVSSASGIGGGIIHVPFLIVVLGLPVHVATATSHFVLSISALAGTVTYLVLGHVDVRMAALLGLGVLAGAQVGARTSMRTSATLIRRVLAGGLALVGARMLVFAMHLLHVPRP
jgi:uncharacterized membrane protein YfcA